MATVSSGSAEEAQPIKLTYEQFLDWADEDTLAEWVDGEVIMTSPASARHQEIKTFLVRVLMAFVELHHLGAVYDAPFQMKLPRSGREPDLLYVAAAHLNQLKKTYLDGPADLAVEIISPESVARDRSDKFREYQEARIPEYWLIDPETHRAEFYQLDSQGAYQFVAPDADGVYRAAVLPGFWLRVAWLWEEPLPDVEDVLLEVGGDAYERYLLERIRRRHPSGDSQQPYFAGICA